MLEDGQVKLWYRNLARGSKITADVRLRRLGASCQSLILTPNQLIELGEKIISDVLASLPKPAGFFYQL
ncbi:MAG: hypothetical protein QW176_01820 [Candidatus Bathyarchaeia archaeon]